jgi:hypothetical protein
MPPKPKKSEFVRHFLFVVASTSIIISVLTMKVEKAMAAVLWAASDAVVAAFMNEPLSKTTCPFPTVVQSRPHPMPMSSPVVCTAMSTSNSGDGDETINLPTFITTPVLALVYPALLVHKEKYGNPNIPLGSADGKRCKTLRRMHFQNKLSTEETSHLTELGFRFHSFEDVYYECDFDEMLSKLIAYHHEFETYQVPKKYEPDPELGAWVTMLRRLRRTNDLPKEQVDKLDAINFEWTSNRRCGSSFMTEYREVLSYLSKVVEAGGDVKELLHEDNHFILKWVSAQRLAYENGNLSESRMKYMDELPGIDWRNPTSWA